jgi:alanyl-tRNA synthetase
MDGFRAETTTKTVWVIFSGGERPGVHVSLTDDLVARGVKAGDLVSRIAAVSGGKGGGRPHFASGGLGDPAKLGETRQRTAEIVRAALAQQGVS